MMDPILAELITYALRCNCGGYEYEPGEPDLSAEQWATLYAQAVEQGYDWPACGWQSHIWVDKHLQFGPCIRPQQHPSDHQDDRGQSRPSDDQYGHR